MLHKALEGAIILETFPKTTVDVFALVLESGGSKFTVFNNDSINLELSPEEFSFKKKKLKKPKKWEKKVTKNIVKEFKFGFMFSYIKLQRQFWLFLLITYISFFPDVWESYFYVVQAIDLLNFLFFSNVFCTSIIFSISQPRILNF